MQICKPHSSANLVIKGLIYLEARACFSVQRPDRSAIQISGNGLPTVGDCLSEFRYVGQNCIFYYVLYYG